jgi:hypothetical protein
MVLQDELHQHLLAQDACVVSLASCIVLFKLIHVTSHSHSGNNVSTAEHHLRLSRKARFVQHVVFCLVVHVYGLCFFVHRAC